MRLAVADPPYLGRAALWYGGRGRPRNGSPGRACGRGPLSPEFHPEAARWDDPHEHVGLMQRLAREYDGWAMAASSKTLHLVLPAAADLGARCAVWHVTNAIPDGARVRCVWEALLFQVPESRRATGVSMQVPDVLCAAHPKRGFVGSKPAQWVTWVLDLLGYDPDVDTVDDLFPGSGAVAEVIRGRLM